MSHILLVEDHQDVFENIERKIKARYSDYKISLATNCDDGFKQLLQYKQTKPVKVVILDLTFTTTNKHSILKTGRDFIKAKHKEGLNTSIIVYSAHDSLLHIQPTIDLGVEAYVIKTHNSSEELMFAVNRVINNEHFFSDKVNKLLLKRARYEHHLDEIDEQIIKHLPQASDMMDWQNTIPGKKGFLSYKSIKLRIDKLCLKFEVENEKQLLLKLHRLALL